MKHYKDSNNIIHAFESDGSQDAFIKPDMVLLSDAELAILRAPTPEQIAAAALQAQDEAAKNVAIVNPVIQYLVSHTPAECIEKVNTDVTDLASAKIMLGHFAVALCVLAKEKLRE
jgi:hypothetical protein